MKSSRGKPTSIDEYIAGFGPEVRSVLQRIRDVIRAAAPEATETISYGIPAFKLNRVLVYFAAFKKHIGFYPPIFGDKVLEKAASVYAGEKGNLRFPIDEPIPYNLIKKLVKLRVKQDRLKAARKAQRTKRTRGGR